MEQEGEWASQPLAALAWTKPKVDIGTTTDYENICKNMYNKAEIVDTSVRKSGRTRMLKVEDRERRLWKEERPQSF